MSDENKRLMLAFKTLRDDEHFKVIVAEMKARRDGWRTDTRTPAVYQNHAELVMVTARAAELDHWLDMLE